MDAKDYIYENDRILNEWQEAFIKNGGREDQFSYDGIMFKGQIHRENGEESNWVHSPHGNENQLWTNSKRRILFLTKDQNTEDGGAWDTRIESYHHKSHNIEDYFLAPNLFARNLVCTLYGLLKVSPKSYLGLNDFTKEQALETVDEAIFARINCKKSAGTNRCTPSNLNKHMSDYKEYLCRQIKNLDADVLVCCGNNNGKNHILDFLNEGQCALNCVNEKSYINHQYVII